MRIHTTTLKRGIAKTAEFKKKGLAEFAVNVGTKCGHGCSYCSTGAMLRMHPAFKQAGENPFASGYAIVDPATPERVAYDAAKLRQRGLIQLCTTVDAWSPEAQQYGLGRKCLEAILSRPGWTVRILTKNAAVMNDFDLIGKYRERVLVGLSLTAPLSKANIVAAVEPQASPIAERMGCSGRRVAGDFERTGCYAPFCPDFQAELKCTISLTSYWTAAQRRFSWSQSTAAGRGSGSRSRRCGMPDTPAKLRH